MSDFSISKALKAYSAAGTSGAAVVTSMAAGGAPLWMIGLATLGAALATFAATWYPKNESSAS